VFGVINRRLVVLVVVAMLTLARRIEAQAPAHHAACSQAPGKVALVLPGGGAKGYAHVGVIKILDSLGIVPDLVVGTSMGSIMGAVYASGYTGEQIERLTQRFNIGPYIGQYKPRPPRAFAVTGATGAQAMQSQLPGAPSPTVMLRKSGSGFALETSFADEGAINLLLTSMMARGNMIARGNFDSLPTPFRAVGTDIHSGARVVIDHGDLARGVRASMAIPFVFDPGVVDSVEMVDGGLAENVPVKLARELGAKTIILSTLDATKGQDSLTRVKQKGTLDMMLDRIFLDTHPPLGPNDLEIRTDVSDIGNLDFADSVVDLLTKRGANAARPVLTASCLPRPGRVVSAMPPVATALVTADAAPGSLEIIRSAVRTTAHYRGPAVRNSLDTVQARVAHAGTLGVLRSLWLNPEHAAGDSVVFDPTITWAPKRVLAVGAAFDNDLGGEAWVGWANRHAEIGSLHPLEIGSRFSFGSRRQELLASFRKSIDDVRYGPSPFLVAMAGRESSPFFAQTGNGVNVKVDLPLFSEQLLQFGIDVPNGDSWNIQAGPVLRHWRGGLTPNTKSATPLGVALRVDEGNDKESVFGRFDAELNQRYSRVSGRFTVEVPRSFALFTNTLRAGGASTEAPFSQWFLLGATDGFPGLNIGEFVGTWSASYMLDMAKPLFGPLNLQVTGATGTVSRSSDVNFGGQWLWGARIGIGADPAIGLIRLQYGLATNGRRQWFARVGRWL